MLLVSGFRYTGKKSMQSFMRCGNTASGFHSINFFCVTNHHTRRTYIYIEPF